MWEGNVFTGVCPSMGGGGTQVPGSFPGPWSLLGGGTPVLARGYPSPRWGCPAGVPSPPPAGTGVPPGWHWGTPPLPHRDSTEERVRSVAVCLLRSRRGTFLLWSKIIWNHNLIPFPVSLEHITSSIHPVCPIMLYFVHSIRQDLGCEWCISLHIVYN